MVTIFDLDRISIIYVIVINNYFCSQEPPENITRKRHPAGEIFVPPQPYLDDDDHYGDMWDV